MSTGFEMSRFIGAVCLVAIMIDGKVGTETVAPGESSAVRCPRVPGVAGTTMGPHPLGDFIGFEIQKQHPVNAEARDVMALQSNADGILIGWAYVDQDGLLWLQLTGKPAGITSADLGGIELTRETQFLRPGKKINSVRVSLRRCSNFG
jgi:hypothetical protein